MSNIPGHQRRGREDKFGWDVTVLGVEHDITKLLADCFWYVLRKFYARSRCDSNETGFHLSRMKNIRHRHHNVPRQRLPADKRGAIVDPNQTFGVKRWAITQKKAPQSDQADQTNANYHQPHDH